MHYWAPTLQHQWKSILQSILNGRDNGNFDPKGTATRAEIATMFVKFIDAYMPQNEITENTAETE